MGCLEFTQEELERPSAIAPVSLPFDPRHIADKVAQRWGTTAKEMLGKGPYARSKHLAADRSELYADLRARGWSFPEIGRFAGRDHTTVLVALRGR